MKKHSLLISIILITAFFLSGCHTDRKEAQAKRLQSVVYFYKYVAFNRQKAQAAEFLIDNMKYHSSSGKTVDVDPLLEQWRKETDSLYYSVVNGHTLSDFPTDSLRKVQARHKEKMRQDSLPSIVCDMSPHQDLEVISPRFLIRHINHAFRMWKTSPFAQGLSFDDFKEYILPYRSIEGYGFLMTGKDYSRLFEKYVRCDTAGNVRNCVNAYNQAVCGFREMNGNTKREGQGGIYDLYTHGKHECVDVASYGCNILRACGLPVVVEFNICYRYYSGRHFHCSVWNRDSCRWEEFNAESSLPRSSDLAFSETMNVYRQMYGAQRDTPYFLRAKDEPIPPLLDNPCIRDVTSRVRTTTSVTLPIEDIEGRNLAYLATFSREFGGVLPVTWGIIDKENRTVTFNQVVPDALYFPVYYVKRQLQPFGQPFYVSLSEEKDALVSPIPYTDHKFPSDSIQADTFDLLTLNRKFPRKPNMIRLAEELVGGRFLGANKRDFSDAVVLYEIKEAPLPYLLDYPLKRTGKYRYYRFQSPDEHPHANISMLEWITESSRGYTNTLPPTRPHIFLPKDTIRWKQEDRWVKLLDEDSWDKMCWKAEYDGNMQTAPGAYPNITLWLKEPQVVTHVRFAPKNADNGIQSGDTFDLLFWDNGWRYAGSCRAEYEFVSFTKVPKGKLYWLRNRNRGKEEQLFVLDGTEQKFLYSDFP